MSYTTQARIYEILFHSFDQFCIQLFYKYTLALNKIVALVRKLQIYKYI